MQSATTFDDLVKLKKLLPVQKLKNIEIIISPLLPSPIVYKACDVNSREEHSIYTDEHYHMIEFSPTQYAISREIYDSMNAQIISMPVGNAYAINIVERFTNDILDPPPPLMWIKFEEVEARRKHTLALLNMDYHR